MSGSSVNVKEITTQSPLRLTKEVFSLAFNRLGGVERLVKWAEGLEGTCTTPAKGNNLKIFYTLFAKTLPKELKTEDMNKSQENFIKLIQAQEEQKRIEKGTPTKLIEASVENLDKNKPNTS